MFVHIWTSSVVLHFCQLIACTVILQCYEFCRLAKKDAGNSDGQLFLIFLISRSFCHILWYIQVPDQCQLLTPCIPNSALFMHEHYHQFYYESQFAVSPSLLDLRYLLFILLCMHAFALSRWNLIKDLQEWNLCTSKHQHSLKLPHKNLTLSTDAC